MNIQEEISVKVKQTLKDLTPIGIIVILLIGIGVFKHTEDLTDKESQALVTELTKIEATETTEAE